LLDIPDEERLEALAARLEGLLRERPEGWREHELLGRLQEELPAEFRSRPWEGALDLFRRHALLFHGLHRLDLRLERERRGRVRIHCLDIRLLPWEGAAAGGAPAGGPHPGAADPLRAYYLDLEALRRTRPEDVAALLDAFWRRLGAREGREADLAALGLEEGADEAAIRRRFRELAMRHHPDRGGDPERFQAIRAAYERLLEGGR